MLRAIWLWPSASIMAYGLWPCAGNRLVQAWRRPWKRIEGKAAWPRSRLDCLRTLLRCSGVLTVVVDTKPHSCQSDPAAGLSSSC